MTTVKQKKQKTEKKHGHQRKTESSQSRGPVKNKTWVTDESGQPWLIRRSQLMGAEIVSRPDTNG